LEAELFIQLRFFILCIAVDTRISSSEKLEFLFAEKKTKFVNTVHKIGSVSLKANPELWMNYLINGGELLDQFYSGRV
jgi:hypothetical protein